MPVEKKAAKEKEKVRRRYEAIREIKWSSHRPWEFHSVPRLAKFTMLCRGKWCRKYNVPEMDVVDLETGELSRAVGVHIGERVLMRDFILSRMRVQVRHFAFFVLQFRNYRRGTTPGLDELARWYAELFDLRSDNVRRYLSTLRETGFMGGFNRSTQHIRRTSRLAS